MNWCFTSKRRAGKLAATIRNDLVHVHVELRTASRHPYVQRKHIFVLSGKDLVTGLCDQSVAMAVESRSGVVGVGSGFLQRGVRCDHLPRDQVLTDAEVLQRALRLSAPEFISRNVNLAEAVSLVTKLLGLDLTNSVCTHKPWPQNEAPPAT